MINKPSPYKIFPENWDHSGVKHSRGPLERVGFCRPLSGSLPGIWDSLSGSITIYHFLLTFPLPSPLLSNLGLQGFCLWDSPGTTIEPYFGPAADFLDLVLSAPGGKVRNRMVVGVFDISKADISTIFVSIRIWHIEHVVKSE